MYLVTQSFGRTNEYKRAILTILSFYSYTSLPVEEAKVILFTDQPQYFKPYFEGLPVEYVTLTADKIKAMRGEIDFLHRMKIALIDEAFSITNSNILYADSDTFFVGDPTSLMQQLTPGNSFMHVLEYSFKSMRNLELPAGKTFLDFLHLIESKTFSMASGAKLKISPEDLSWNAGVMMLHLDHRRFIPDVYALTDQFYPSTLNHASEQYAFSILLQKYTDLQPCDAVIYHYWYRIKKQVADIFLERNLNAAWPKLPLSEKLSQVKEFTKILPGYFNSHILMIKDNAIQAFNEQRFLEGYRHSLKAILKKPVDMEFLRNVVYHTTRMLTKK